MEVKPPSLQVSPCIHCAEKQCSCRSNLGHFHQRINPRHRSLECTHCGKTFNSSSVLRRHEMKHADVGRYVCPKCPKRFRRNTYLIVHLQMHTGEHRHTCKQCNQVFTQLGNLRRHERIHSGEVRSLVCKRCDKQFKNTRNLEVHERKHMGDLPFACEQCDKRFFTSDSLSKHKFVHTGERPHGCSQCDKRFKDSGHLRRHERIHTGNYLHACIHCSRKFHQLGGLRRHEALHNQEEYPYECTHCEKRFKRQKTLHSHEIKHIEKYRCTQCDEKFSTASNLRRHMHIHIDDVSHVCTVCRIQFKQLAFLRRHERIHDGKRQYSCRDNEREKVLATSPHLEIEKSGAITKTSMNKKGNIKYIAGMKEVGRKVDKCKALVRQVDQKFVDGLRDMASERLRVDSIVDNDSAHNEMSDDIVNDDDKSDEEMSNIGGSQDCEGNVEDREIKECKGKAQETVNVKASCIEDILLEAEDNQEHGKNTPKQTESNKQKIVSVKKEVKDKERDKGAQLDEDISRAAQATTKETRHNCNTVTNGNSFKTISVDQYIKSILSNNSTTSIKTDDILKLLASISASDLLNPCPSYSSLLTKVQLVKTVSLPHSTEVSVVASKTKVNDVPRRASVFWSDGFEGNTSNGIHKIQTNECSALPVRSRFKFWCGGCSGWSDTERDVIQCFYRHFPQADINSSSRGNVPNEANKAATGACIQSMKCPWCQKLFTNNSYFRRHKRTHLGEPRNDCPRTLNCPWCEKIFTNVTYWRQHKRTHRGEAGARPFSCTQCSKTFRKQSNLGVHMLLHRSERPYRCNQCLKTFTSRSNLRVHQVVHTGERSFACTQCEKRFGHSSSLTKHLRTHLSATKNLNQFVCPRCGKTFTQSYNLRIHERVHTGERTHKCFICDRWFSLLASLRRHELRHNGKRPYLCGKCNKGFSTASLLTTHERIKHLCRAGELETDTCEQGDFTKRASQCLPKFGTYTLVPADIGEQQFECHQCKKHFTHLRYLKQHEFRHTDEHRYGCTLCGKTFKNASDVPRHERTHNKDSWFMCKHCDKRFAQFAHVKLHERIHTGERPFACSQCDRRFRDASDLKKA